jgi:hypothetical protein
MEIIKKKILLATVLFLILSFWSSPVLADSISLENQFSYLFHLYFDNGKLVADKDFQFKYDLIAGPFVPEKLNTTTPYRGEVINSLNKTEATFKFDPRQGSQTFVRGKISVKGPRFADAQKVNFYNDKDQLLLTLDVSGSSFCNDDGICNSDFGENHNNCPNDCKLLPKPTPSASPSPATSGGFPSAVFVVIAVVVVAIVVWLVWFIIKKRKARSGMIPPIVPPNI